ncbi:MAG: T9SS type A sorting domain-containing protein [Bacteroidota bacterium]|nr:T9SS type A sorting domain-containing protein [Bacteroidota bacterium]
MRAKITLLLGIVFLGKALIAQNNQISLNSSYTNQSFYSMQNGEVLNVSNEDWDIAFSTASFSSSIRTNDGKGVELYTYQLGDTSAWNNISSNDINNLPSLMFNTDTSWQYGAFDTYQTGGFDYGWGVYNIQTHHLTGDSLFLIKTINNNWKKLWIKSKILGEYHITYADLDGTNVINTTIEASNYADKNFIYYSLDNHQTIDREPNKDAWDITFTKYLTLYPFQGGFTPYSVTGVLHNDGIEVAQADNISSPLTYSNYSLHSFSSIINTIGYDWKEFQGSYVIVPNRCYFVLDKLANIWRLTFTNFDGTSTGNIEFNTELIQTTNVDDIDLINTFAIYPNPVCINQNITVLYDLNSNNKGVIKLHDLLGREVYSANVYNRGLMSHIIKTDNFEKGIYTISININGVKKTDRIMIN